MTKGKIFMEMKLMLFGTSDQRFTIFQSLLMLLADGHIPWACEAFSRFHGQDLMRDRDPICPVPIQWNRSNGTTRRPSNPQLPGPLQNQCDWSNLTARRSSWI